jgi:sec-independent protein translocase protein TatB
MLSIPHLIIIFIVALVVFGPEKLPELARNLGKVMAEFRRATGEFRSTFEDHLRDLERESEQRRIGGATSAAGASAAPSAPAAPPMTLAEATVPATPPQSAIGAHPVSEDAAVHADAHEPAASEPDQSHPHPGVEKPSDGGLPTA